MSEIRVTLKYGAIALMLIATGAIIDATIKRFQTTKDLPPQIPMHQAKPTGSSELAEYDREWEKARQDLEVFRRECEAQPGTTAVPVGGAGIICLKREALVNYYYPKWPKFPW